MRFTVLSVALAAAVLLASCATPYAPEGLTGGFDNKELRADVLRVRFDGNGYTSKETAQTYWLYRAAELTLEKGYAGFEILSDMQFVRHLPVVGNSPEHSVAVETCRDSIVSKHRGNDCTIRSVEPTGGLCRRARLGSCCGGDVLLRWRGQQAGDRRRYSFAQ
jgi:hypothetical protein